MNKELLASKQLIIVSGEDLERLIASLSDKKEEKPEEVKSEESISGRILSRKEVTKMLHVDNTTLWRWDRNGVLPARRIGARRVYYLYDDIIQLLLNKREDLK